MTKAKTPIKRKSKSAPRKTGPNGGTHGRKTKSELASSSTILADNPALANTVMDLVEAKMSELEDRLGKPECWEDAKVQTQVFNQVLTGYAKTVEAYALSAQYLTKASVNAYLKKVQETFMRQINSVTSIQAEIEDLTVDQRKEFNEGCKRWQRETQESLGDMIL